MFWDGFPEIYITAQPVSSPNLNDSRVLPFVHGHVSIAARSVSTWPHPLNRPISNHLPKPCIRHRCVRSNLAP